MPFKTQSVNGDFKFKNVHGNYEEDFEELIRLYNDPSLDGYEAYNDTTIKIRDIISQALTKNKRLRACGSLWSLSKIPYAEHIHVFSYNEYNIPDLRFKTFLTTTETTGTVPAENLLFAQCGNRIKDLSQFCEDAGQSLQTSGASNGQTIAGAIGTGVHGSSIDVGSIQDTVQALHIITGPEKSHSVLIQADSNRVVNEEFAAKMNATLLNDDKLFAAALVNLGAFGYVHGVIIQTETFYHLANAVIDVTYRQVIEYLKTYSLSDANIPSHFGFPESDLFHVKFFINQYDFTSRAELIYKVSPRAGDLPPFLKYNKDFLMGAGKFLNTILPSAIPKLINFLLPKVGTEFGSLAQIFGDTENMRDGQYACAIAVDTRIAHQLVGIIIQEARHYRKVPCVLSLRFVPKSKATLAFTKYANNCIIGLDGIDTKATRSFVQLIAKKFIESEVEHTWHWGKHNVMDKNFVKNMYGEGYKEWHEQRLELLKGRASTFTSKYLNERGL